MTNIGCLSRVFRCKLNRLAIDLFQNCFAQCYLILLTETLDAHVFRYTRQEDESFPRKPRDGKKKHSDKMVVLVFGEQD